MIMSKLLKLFFLGYVAAATGNAEICKWVDDEGKVHFGDCPAASRKSEKIQVAPMPSDQKIQEAHDRFKRLQEYEKTLRESPREEVLSEDVKQAEEPVIIDPTEAECFTPLSETWGDRISDIRDELRHRPIAVKEIRRFTKLFRSLKGHWRGSMEDMKCVRPDATPPVKTYTYDVRLNARWQADKQFWIEADLTGIENRSVKQQFYWFLVKRDGLYFRKAMTDISHQFYQPQLYQPGNIVEILTLEKNRLTFFWRRGGAVRKANVFSLRKLGQKFTIRELFYVQGTLIGIRVWTIGK